MAGSGRKPVRLPIGSEGTGTSCSGGLVAEFEEVARNTLVKINKHLEKSEAELDKAVALAEKFGVPMVSMGRTYVPNSLKKKWPFLVLEDPYENSGFPDGEFDAINEMLYDLARTSLYDFADHTGWISSSDRC